MSPSVLARRERTMELAEAFLEEVRRDLERAVARAVDLPARLRSVHERPGHSTPEYRTLAIPVPDGAAGASPQALSGLIARYAALRPCQCLMLALDALMQGDDATPRSVLIAEAQDCEGTRLFYQQPFSMEGGVVRWGSPTSGGWFDPGGEEMILDAAFAR